MKFYKIGFISNLYKISPDTIRNYEKIGLIKPAIVKESGYRYYSSKQIWKLNLIQTLKNRGCNLLEIKEFLYYRDIEVSSDFYRSQLAIIKRKRKELLDIYTDIELRLNHLENCINKIQINVYSQILVEPLSYWLLDTAIDSIWDIDLKHNELSQLHYNNTHSHISLGRYGTTISLKNFTQQAYTNYSNCFILDIQGDKALSAHKCLVVYVRNHNTHEEIAENYRKLKLYIEQHQLQVIGDVREIYIIDIHDTDNLDEHITQIQVPIK